MRVYQMPSIELIIYSFIFLLSHEIPHVSPQMYYYSSGEEEIDSTGAGELLKVNFLTASAVIITAPNRHSFTGMNSGVVGNSFHS